MDKNGLFGYSSTHKIAAHWQKWPVRTAEKHEVRAVQHDDHVAFDLIHSHSIYMI